MKIGSIKLLFLVLLGLLLINPVVLFIVTDSCWISLLFTLVAVTILVATYVTVRLKFLTPYLISLLSALSILLHAEAVFINNFKEYIIEDLYILSNRYYFNRPFLKKALKDKEYNVNYVTSKQGFRIGYEDNPEVEVEECDWLFLGDSYTQGAQVEFEDLYTTKLYKHFPDRVIVNGGISGWGIPEAFNYYVNEGYKLRPEKVFLQICNFNDFMNVNEKEISFTDFIMNHSEFLRFLLYPFKYANPAELPLGRWTEPFYPTEQANRDYNIFFKAKSALQKNDLLNFSIFLKRLNDAVKANGAELIVFQIPTKEQLYYRYFEEVVQGFNIDVKALDMSYPNRFLAEICMSNTIKYLDLLIPVGEKEEEIFFQYDEHLNTIGHQRVASILGTFIKDKVDTSRNKRIQLLSNHNSEDRYPVFHDLNLLSYQSVRDSNIELFTADSLLENSSRITFDDIDELHPWIDNGRRRIVFTEGDQGNGMTRIGSMLLSGADRKYLTKDGFYGAIPSLNKGGTKIAFPEWFSTHDGFFTNPSIVVLDLTTETKTKISDGKYESWRPIFSPNDSLLFYISKRNNEGFDIYQYDLMSKIETNLTKTSFDEWDPFISPDGSKIVYAGFKDGNWDIFLLDIVSGNTIQLTKTIGNEWDTSFSPDGRYIYYAGVYGFMNGIYRLKI